MDDTSPAGAPGPAMTTTSNVHSAAPLGTVRKKTRPAEAEDDQETPPGATSTKRLSEFWGGGSLLRDF